MTLEWKVRSYRSENGRKIMGKDQKSLENRGFLQISQLVLRSKFPWKSVDFHGISFSIPFPCVFLMPPEKLRNSGAVAGQKSRNHVLSPRPIGPRAGLRWGPRSGAALPQAHALANPDNVLLRNVFAQDQPQKIHIISPGKNYLPGSRG